MRVQFLDPLTGQVSSLPIAWTNLANIEPFVQLSAGRAMLRTKDLLDLSVRLHELASHADNDWKLPHSNE